MSCSLALEVRHVGSDDTYSTCGALVFLQHVGTCIPFIRPSLALCWHAIRNKIYYVSLFF